MNTRQLLEVIQAKPTSDGAGVKLFRVFGGSGLERFDPFLMLDDFGTDNPNDYIAGFPPHPHRGFQTVTYMLKGEFEHRDHMGHVGAIGTGGVQWMNAGSGVIHSEMPIQTEGSVRGFQLWINLPAKEKMSPANYDNLQPDQIASYMLNGLSVKAIAGEANVNGHAVLAHKQLPDTQLIYLAVHNQNPTAQEASIQLPDGHNLLVYLAQGSAILGEQHIQERQLLRFDHTGVLTLTLEADTLVLIMSGKPLQEPIVQHGPFVMNSQEQIEQAIADYQNGTLTEPVEV